MEIMLKRYPSCVATHPALDALCELRREVPFSWEDVEETECLVTPINLHVLTYPNPRNGLEAKFGMPYCLSTFMAHNRLALQDFEGEALDDSRVRKMMTKFRLRPDETLGELANTRDLLPPTEVCVRLKDRTLSKMMLQARGGPSCPLTIDEIKKKFRTCARRALPENRIDRTMELILSLESVPKISNLTEILGS
jgi:2-methylcitrate dehydratase PrpD